MKKNIFSVIVAALLTGASGLGNAFAGGGASAEDANTIFFNPSGMTYLPDNQLVLVAHAIRFSADLGAVELENRFADFDKISNLQQKPAKEKKSKNDKTPLGKALSGSILDSADFIQDLEEIKNQKITVNIDQQIATSSTFTDKWNRIAYEVFGYTNYDDYIAKELKTTAFFGQSLLNLNDEMVQSLRKVEADLTTSQGSGYKAPFANSTLRKKTGMHGWGMAVDFDVEKNPYVLNENSEEQLNKELIGSYDNIAKLMLGKTQSDLRQLKRGRSAFGTGSIGDVYDVLREESDAMKRYFSLMNDDAALQSFFEQEWTVKHPDQTPPDFAKTKAQMKDDYEVLGGKTSTGVERSTGGKEDRPFAPTSFGGKGDPATGFLNLGKEFVEAMTNAGFAWGAIDISGEPGDIQHFDLRLQGIGAKIYNLLLKYKYPLPILNESDILFIRYSYKCCNHSLRLNLLGCVSPSYDP